MDKRDLIALRDTVTLDPELKSGLRWAIKRIEDLESDLREADVFGQGHPPNRD